MKSLRRLAEQALASGECVTLSREQTRAFHAAFAAHAGPSIGRIRAETRRAWAQARSLLVD
ncbi:hypothetical protein [Thioalkalivibrio thiocyanodenitrificans]|uniref:hypothetical protein n=1 Tax=Thioalkalivibrio thiocyanodenitrificans TaxID=243063 RepID=UPI00037E2652|nr:hypothetical protein [Thioalkalivibrio thiocyanodenitrificans]